MSARRIVICLHDFTRGGTERVAIDLARLWTQAGRDVTILCGAQEGGLRGSVDPRVTVVTLDPPLRRGLLSRFRLGRAMGGPLAALDPDVLFLPGNFHLFLAGALRKAAPRAVIALKISNPPLPGGFGAPLFRFFTRAVDGFAAMNEGLARELARMLPGRAVATLYDPVKTLPPQAAPPRQPDSCNILWIGRLEPQKDAGLALRTLQALRQSAPAHLTLLGDGSLRAQTRARMAALGLGDHVTWHDHVPDISAHLAGADALLITSQYEGGPAVAVEALAQDLPLVSTDCSHMLHEIMTIPEAGRIVASRDPHALAGALLAVWRNPRPAPGTLAALAARFAPGICAQAYLDWFDALVRDRHG